jgi:MarC family membrane protein
MDIYGFMLFSVSSLFAVIDPLGCIPFFSGQTAGMSAAEKKRVLIKALLVSLLVLLIFAYFGDAVLHLFGITIDAFRIAGGVIFFGIGLDMLQSKPRRWRTGLSNPEDDEGEIVENDPDHDPSITPLAIPMISGPGSITTVMVLKAQAPGIGGEAFVAAAIIAILLLTGLILFTADTVLRRMGHTGMKVVEKLMGLLVTVIAVQLIMSGVKPFVLGIMG